MLSDTDIRALVAQKAETPNLDYKAGFTWTQNNRDKKYELVRDLMAMANTKDGGRVVLGVRDGDFELIGLPDDIYTSLDPNNVVQMLHDVGAPKVKCTVSKPEVDGKRLVVLDVVEFGETPVICQTFAKGMDGKVILREGAIYIRTEAATSEEIKSPEEMRDLLNRALARRKEDLLQSIGRVLSGRPTVPSEDALQHYAPEVEGGRHFLKVAFGSELGSHGYWEVLAFPTNYETPRADLRRLREMVRKSAVSLRGWDYPYTVNADVRAFGQGVESANVFREYIEGYRLYQSGLFLWKGGYWEDLRGGRTADERRALDFVSLICSFTESMLFLSRLYGELAPDASVSVRISLQRCKDRALASFGRAPEVLSRSV
jgi:hypothetical protein